MLSPKYISNDHVNSLYIGVYYVNDEAGELDQASTRQFVQLAVRDLLQDSTLVISRRETGVPFIEGKEELSISISHSQRWIAIAVSSRIQVGIDVQVTGKQDLRRGAYYFMNDHELKGDWTARELYLIWCAKEALFKLKHGQVPKYKDDIQVMEISESKINASVCGDYPQTSYLEMNPNVILVFSLLES